MVAQVSFPAKTVEASAAEGERQHYNSVASVCPNSPSIMSNDPSALYFPIPAVQVQIGSTNAACPETDQNPSAFNLWIGYIFNPDTLWSPVDYSLQKQGLS
jgi:hypothetical protein